MSCSQRHCQKKRKENPRAGDRPSSQSKSTRHRIRVSFQPNAQPPPNRPRHDAGSGDTTTPTHTIYQQMWSGKNPACLTSWPRGAQHPGKKSGGPFADPCLDPDQGLETPQLRLVRRIPARHTCLRADQTHQRKTRRSSPPILASSRAVHVWPSVPLSCPCLPMSAANCRSRLQRHKVIAEWVWS